MMNSWKILIVVNCLWCIKRALIDECQTTMNAQQQKMLQSVGHSTVLATLRLSSGNCLQLSPCNHPFFVTNRMTSIHWLSTSK